MNAIPQIRSVSNLSHEIRYELMSVLFRCLSLDIITDGRVKQIFSLAESIVDLVEDDLLALARRDPAAQNDAHYVLTTYAAFYAVMCYRLAHAIFINEFLDGKTRMHLARTISEAAKVKSGVEIHPAAKIGERFVVDHGIGTVIGETCEIGDDCYILNGVILGARKIAKNAQGKRHPTIGNKVEIGAFSKLLGPIEIGDNVIISPNCVITDNVAANTKIFIVNQLQVQHISKNIKHAIPEIYGVIPEEDGVITAYGANLAMPYLYIVNASNERLNCFAITILYSSAQCFKARIKLLPKQQENLVLQEGVKLQCIFNKENECTLIKSRGLEAILTQIFNHN